MMGRGVRDFFLYNMHDLSLKSLYKFDDTSSLYFQLENSNSPRGAPTKVSVFMT